MKRQLVGARALVGGIVPPLLAVSAALLFAACSDEPTHPRERASTAPPDANIAATAPLTFRQISGGGEHTCGVTTDNVSTPAA